MLLFRRRRVFWCIFGGACEQQRSSDLFKIIINLVYLDNNRIREMTLTV